MGCGVRAKQQTLITVVRKNAFRERGPARV
jgi:hypothetical protein